MRSLPRGCPYTIHQIHWSEFSRSFVIRENDNFGEYPNIFVKCYYAANSDEPQVVVLSDSGTGLNEPASSQTTASQRFSGTTWNIASVLECTVNPKHGAPYIVITTHCHFDHICGIRYLIDARADLTVLASARDVSYLTPWQKLQRHSLCELMHLRAPRYQMDFVDDGSYVTFKTSNTCLTTSIQIFHTPGHTPDSISWYDHDTNMLSVGDMLYERESPQSRSGSGGQWAAEPPMPTIFGHDSKLHDWCASVQKVLGWVRTENARLEHGQSKHPVTLSDAHYFEEDDWVLVPSKEPKPRVVLSAAHVTVRTDAESALLDMLSFMLRIQLDQVPRVRVPNSEGREAMWLWDDCLKFTGTDAFALKCRFSVQAPWQVIHKTPSLEDDAEEAG